MSFSFFFKFRMNELNEILKNFIPLNNECLDLISFSEQRLTRFTSRILVCMKRNEKQFKRAIRQQAHECDDLNNLNILNKFRDNYFNPRNKN